VCVLVIRLALGLKQVGSIFFSVYFATTIYSCKFLASKIESGKSVGWDGVCWHL